MTYREEDAESSSPRPHAGADSSPPPPPEDHADLATTAPTPDEADIPGARSGQVIETDLPPPTRRSPRREITLIDTGDENVRRPSDLLLIVATIAALSVVLVLAVFARATTQAVTFDVQNAFTQLLRQLFQLPINALEGLLAFIVPIAVVSERLVRRRWRSAFDTVLGGLISFAAVIGAIRLLERLSGTDLAAGFRVWDDGVATVALNPYIGALAGLLTIAGPASTNAIARWSWRLMVVVLLVSVLQGQETITGIISTVLLGRLVGLVVRYFSGVRHNRATGIALVRTLRRAGLDPKLVVRMDAATSANKVQAWTVTTDSPVGFIETPSAPTSQSADGSGAEAEGREVYGNLVGPLSSPEELIAAVEAAGSDTIVTDPVTDVDSILTALGSRARSPRSEIREDRIYTVVMYDGARRSIRVLDGDRQMVGFLASAWESIKLRGIDRRPVTSIRESAQRATMMAMAASKAEVRSPLIDIVAAANDSLCIVEEHTDDLQALDQVPAGDLTDDVLDDIWTQVRKAHAGGLTHRDLHAGTVRVDSDSRAWITGWESGEIASSELARRMDLTQILALLACVVGPERALRSASRKLVREQLLGITPLLQRVALPAPTRRALREHKNLLTILRDSLTAPMEGFDPEPIKIARFSPSTVIVAGLLIVALYIVVTTLDFADVGRTLADANLTMVGLAFGFSLITYLGAALALVAFTPTKLKVTTTTTVQVAGSLVSVVAPAGLGPAALNLRYLVKMKVTMPLAVASVGLVQLSQFITTIVFLILITLLTGSGAEGMFGMPSSTVIITVVAALAVVAAALLIPQLRAWVWSKVAPTLRQVWPRLVWVASSPTRLIMGVGGNLIITTFYVATFGFSLAAFGYELPLTTLAVTYLASFSLGSMIPSPGGIGPVEATLTAGLSVAGVPATIALSTALLYRLLTTWLRLPLGWAALTWLRRKSLV